MTRNRLLSAKTPEGWDYVTVPVAHAPQDVLYPLVQVSGGASWLNRLEGQLAFHYARAPHRQDVMEWVTPLGAQSSLLELNIHAIRALSERLGLRARFLDSRDFDRGENLDREARLIHIARQAGATRYINALGGQALYSKARWDAEGIPLAFLEPRFTPYDQGRATFMPGLSVLDALLWNAPGRVAECIASGYTLV